MLLSLTRNPVSSIVRRTSLDTKVLNLYAGVGGNRKLWQGVEVTAVEKNSVIASIYADLYPQDKLIIGDAHQYLLKHYSGFDFIWSSPPCQSHSQMRQNLAVRFRDTPAKYPDMALYQEIIFLQANFNGLWLVENVKPYYKPLIPPTFEMQRHLFWSNFYVQSKQFPTDILRSAQVPDLQIHTGIDLNQYKLSNKRQVLRNCVYPPLGEYIFAQAARRLTSKSSRPQERGFQLEFLARNT